MKNLPALTPKLIDITLENTAFWFKRWKSNPLAYVIEFLEEIPTHQQAEVLIALQKHKFVAARSGHGIGKTKLIAWVIHWYLDTHKESGSMCRIPCTGASEEGLNDTLWGEVSAVWEKKNRFWKERSYITQGAFTYSEDRNGWFATIRVAKADKPEALQGFHNCLFVIDEGSGVPEPVFEVARGAMGDPGCMGLMTGNPTKTSGYYYNVFHRRSIWKTFHFSCSDIVYEKTYSYPFIDAMGDIQTISHRGRQTSAWIKGMMDEFGESSNAYRIRVLGEFAIEFGDCVIEQKYINQIIPVSSVHESNKCRKKIMAVDIADSGEDSSSAVIRQGGDILFALDWHGNDLVETRMKIQMIQDEWKCDKIFIDNIGVGAGTYAELKHLGYPVYPCCTANSAPDSGDGGKARCKTLRDYIWWSGRRFFRNMRVGMMAQENDCMDRLKEELAQPIYNIEGKYIRVESKKDMKKRGLKSPNLADAMIMTLMDDFGEERKFSPKEIASQDPYRSALKKFKENWRTV